MREDTGVRNAAEAVRDTGRCSRARGMPVLERWP